MECYRHHYLKSMGEYSPVGYTFKDEISEGNQIWMQDN